jgi:RNA polymerase sigma-70 factor (ECF subfamily)
VEDLTQEVFLILFADQAKVLRSWDRKRGLSLLNFVGLVAERRALSLLRTGKHSPWTEDPTLSDELDRVSPAPSPEGMVVSRDLLERLLRRLEETLSPLGRHLFELLYIKELSVDEVTSQTGMKRDAVYTWRSRLRRHAQRLMEQGALK